MKHIVQYLVINCCLLSFHAFADDDVTELNSNSLQQELSELKVLYSTGTRDDQIYAINRRIRFSGITDISLFDIAEKNILSAEHKNDEQYISWMAQMLAFSGQEKYIETLKTVLAETESDTVKRHINKSIEVMPKYRAWNITINKNLANTPVSLLNKTRLVNMLNGSDPELVRAGASIADHFYLADIEITDLIEKRLNSIYTMASNKSDDEYAEASAWLCKVLGNTKNAKYKNTLLQIQQTTNVQAIKRWSKKALEKLAHS